MKLNDITNLDTIRVIESAGELFQNKKYQSKDYLEKFLGLMIHRSGFYGRLNGDEILPLERINTTFNEVDDVTILIEGVVNLAKAPVNNGAGDIVFTGGGTLTIIEPGTGITEPGYEGGGSASVVIDETITGDFSPVNAGNTRYLIDSVTDVTITINEDSCPIGQCIEFKQLGTGQLILSAGNIVFNIDIYTSVKTAGTGSTISVFHDKVGEYSIGGQTE